MNNNQATLEKLEKMGMWGMMRALRLSMEAGTKADFTFSRFEITCSATTGSGSSAIAPSASR